VHAGLGTHCRLLPCQQPIEGWTGTDHKLSLLTCLSNISSDLLSFYVGLRIFCVPPLHMQGAAVLPAGMTPHAEEFGVGVDGIASIRELADDDPETAEIWRGYRRIEGSGTMAVTL